MLKPKLACTVWAQMEKAIKEAIGRDSFDAYMSAATQNSDDGKTIILEVPNAPYGLMIRARYGPVLERILRREVKFLKRSRAGAAERDRARQAEDAGRDRRATA